MGPLFIRVLLEQDLIWSSRDIEQELIAILNDESIDIALGKRAAFALSDTEAARDPIRQFLERLPEREASETAWSLAASKLPDAPRELLKRAMQGLKKLSIRRDQDFDTIENGGLGWYPQKVNMHDGQSVGRDKKDSCGKNKSPCF